MIGGPRVAVLPSDAPPAVFESVVAAGGVLANTGEAEALVWCVLDAGALAGVLDSHPEIRWVQLAWAGVEPYRGLFLDGRTWTCAKGVFGELVAEHALLLALAGLREIPRLARASTWLEASTRSLFGARVTIVGGGGIAGALLSLLVPFRARITVVRRHPQPMAGAAEVVAPDALLSALAGADVVFLAPALTPETAGMIGEHELRAMGPRAWLVNVGRGGLVLTDALLRALREGWIAGAALDVTDPEPLPDGHPLFTLDNCLITPHVAGTLAAAMEPFAARVRENVRRYADGLPLIGLIDPLLGY